MGEVRHAEDVFAERSKLVESRRKRGKYPDDERPAALVVAHKIVPEKRRSKPVESKSAPEVKRRFESITAPITATYQKSMPLKSKPVAQLPDIKTREAEAAYKSIERTLITFVNTISKLEKVKANPPRHLKDLRAVLATLHVCIPKLKH